MTAHVKPNWKNRSGALLLIGAGLAVTSSGVPAMAEESGGNSGTIKVSFPTANTDPNNDAKPGCTVRLDFYGFNRGTYDAVFRAVAPTGSKQMASGSVLVTQPRTPASRFQTSKRFTLDVAGLTPDNAGYHIRVEVTNAATKGGAKSKDFTFDCRPGGATAFSGGSGSLSSSAQGRATTRAANGGAVPTGGFDTGAGGSADPGVPLLPAAGLLGGLGLLGAGAALRRRTSS